MPAVETPSAAPSLPLVRECRPGGLRPLLAPGGRDTYFSPEIQRMLFPPDEPLARFLPPAKFVMPDRQERTQDARASHVAYTIPDEVLKTATPLFALARAEIGAFSDAATVFLAKARPDAKGVPPFIRQCRQEFRLPDPDLDRHAYWVYGPEFDRRLLILWGCEPHAGTSLALEQAVAKLRDREMAWRDKQELGLKLATRANEPLARFLARRSADGGIVLNGSSVGPKKLRRLKTIAPGEWRGFESAAKAFYAPAHPGVSATAPFEKEVRREFQLASIQKVPGDYYNAAGRLAIAIDAWPRESTLPITDDAALGLPEAPSAPASAAVVVPSGRATVSAELSARQQPPWVAYARISAVAAGIVLVGALAWIFRPDHTPPQFRSIEAPDPHSILIRFDEPIDPASIQPKPGAGAFADPIFVQDDKAVIASRDLEPGNPRVIVLHTKGALKDGETYALAIKGIADRARAHNVIPGPLSKSVTYLDRTAPGLKAVSAGGPSKRYLVLVFSKPISDDSLSRARFAVAPVDGGVRGRPLRVDASFDPNDRSGATVLLKADEEFVEGKPYVLDVSNLKDRTVSANPVDEKSATNRNFEYVDILPPRLNGIVALGGQFQVKLEFASAVDSATATQLSNYSLVAPNGKPVVIGKVEQPSPAEVVLRLAPQRLVEGPQLLRVERLVGGDHVPLPAPIRRSFNFNDRPSPPVVNSAELVTSNRLKLNFDRIVSAETASIPSNYRVYDENGRSTGLDVRSVEQASDDPSRVVLVLNRAVEPGRYYVETRGLADVFGAKEESPARMAFERKGVRSVIIQSLISWASSPVLRDGGHTLVLRIHGRLRATEAKDARNYSLDPAPKTALVVASVTPDPENEFLTTVTLRSGDPVQMPVSVSAHGLILSAAPGRGGQTLPWRGALR